MSSDMDDNHISPFTDVKFTGTLCQSRTFYFANFFEKLILIACISAAGQIDAFFVKFANELASCYR